jgi:hypothetical protein
MRDQRSGALHRQKAGSDREDTSERTGVFHVSKRRRKTEGGRGLGPAAALTASAQRYLAPVKMGNQKRAHARPRGSMVLPCQFEVDRTEAKKGQREVNGPNSRYLAGRIPPL